MLPLELHDFRKTLCYVWREIGLPDPTDRQYEAAHFLQFGGQKVFISMFRGAGKSYLTAAYVDWSHAMSDHWAEGCDCRWCALRPDVNGRVRARDLRHRVVSASPDKVIEFIGFSKKIIEFVPLFRHLKPTQKSATWAYNRFDIDGAPIAQTPSVTATGIFGTLTGGRANELIWDDVETPNTSATVGQRERLRHRMTEFSALMIPEYSRTIGLGTPQCAESIVDEMEGKGYSVRFWPARYPDGAGQEQLGERLAPELRDAPAELIGKSVEPTRFTDAILEEKRLEMGASEFKLQFDLDTSLSDAERYPLRLRDLIIMDVDPETAPDKVVWASGDNQKINELSSTSLGFHGDYFVRPMMTSSNWVEAPPSVMFIDPSGTGQDETAYATVYEACGTVFCSDLGGFLGGYDEPTLRALAMAAKAARVGHILVEKNFGGGMFTSLLSPVIREVYRDPEILGYVADGCVIEEIHSTGQKELRIIETLEPLVNQHRLVLDMGIFLRDRQARKGVPDSKALAYKLGYQFTHITKERGSLAHDDRIEALAGACRYLAANMGKDREEEALKARTEQAIAEASEYVKELEEILEDHGVIPEPSPNAISRIIRQHS